MHIIEYQTFIPFLVNFYSRNNFRAIFGNMTHPRGYTLELSPQHKVMKRWENNIYRGDPRRNISEDFNPEEIPDMKSDFSLSEQKRIQAEKLKQLDEEFLNAEKARALFEKQKKLQQQESYRNALDKYKKISEKNKEEIQSENNDFFSSLFESENQRRIASRNMEKKLTEEAYNDYLNQEAYKKNLHKVDDTVEIPIFTNSDLKSREISRRLAIELRDTNYRLMLEKRKKLEDPQRFRASLI